MKGQTFQKEGPVVLDAQDNKVGHSWKAEKKDKVCASKKQKRHRC